MKLNVKAFSLTSGLILGVGIFLLTWWMLIVMGVSGNITAIGRVYPGYYITPLGSVIGLFYGFLDGLIVGAIFAWLYNLISARSSS